MHKGTLLFNRQLIRLGKGMLKAWEQWVDEVELETVNNASESQPQLAKGTNGANTNNGTNHERTVKV